MVDVSIVIPTHDRPQLLARAVDSALAQTHGSLEVVVVDDGSVEPVELADERTRVFRHPSSRGCAAARNTGLRNSQGRWVTFLDDDDCLLPHMLETSLEALAKTTHPPPVGVLSGIEVVDERGRVLGTKLPPTCPKGTWFGVEAISGYRFGPPYETKQTLVIEREILLGLDGWIEDFRTRGTAELFLRLSQVCTLLGLPVVTYRQLHHRAARLTSDPLLRQDGLERLIRTHRSVFEAHPEGYADHLRRHAHHLRRAGRWDQALLYFARALRLAPASTVREAVASAKRAGVGHVRRTDRHPRGAEL